MQRTPRLDIVTDIHGGVLSVVYMTADGQALPLDSVTSLMVHYDVQALSEVTLTMHVATTVERKF